MEYKTTEAKRKAYKNWYEKQKNPGVVYALVEEGTNRILYVGSTTNSLNKRLWQHKANRKIKETYIMIPLEILKRRDCIREREQYWITYCCPTYNKTKAYKVSDKKDKVYKGGILFNGVFYSTKLELWKRMGNTAYGTFKSRLSRSNNLTYALGLE